MKIAISSEGPGLESMVDPRFGRAAGFVLLETEDMAATYLDNGASQVMAQGAGIETAERVAASGAKAVLSGYVGPKAFDCLKAAGIAVYQDMDGRSVGDAVKAFMAGARPALPISRSVMRIAIASGKGGAGKTTVTACLASIWDRECIVVDADVEAPNLHLFLHPSLNEPSPVYLSVPELDRSRCTDCGLCRDICSYKAIARFGSGIVIFPDMCHGCGGCFEVCAAGALKQARRELGTLSAGTISGGRIRFLMGRTRIGEAMTPPLLRAEQHSLQDMLAEKQADVLMDAPPGVSCPAMAVARQVDLVLLVAEPTPFGFHDFKLAHEAFGQLGTPLAVVMNRAGLPGNAAGDAQLRQYCQEQGLPLLAELPFQREAAACYANGGLPVTEFPAWGRLFADLRQSLQAQEVCHA